MLSSLTIYHYIAISSAAAVSFLLSPLCRRLAFVIGAVDIPRDSRRMHRIPIARAGGMALFPAFFITALLILREIPLSLLIGGSIIFVAGLCDDIFQLSPQLKLACQSASALAVIVTDFHLLIPSGSDITYPVFAFFWIVLLSNAFNLIDGLDALSSRIAAISAVCIFLISGDATSLILAATVIGFLPFNLHPAKMFLGDSGAMLLGFLLSVLSLRALAAEGAASFLPSLILIFALPTSDTALAFFRRLIAKSSPFSPDRHHLHHRLVDLGLSHAAASRILVLFSSALGGIGVIRFISEEKGVLLFCIALTALAVLCILFSLKRPHPNSLPNDR